MFKKNYAVQLFTVPNMHCEHCVNKIKQSLKPVKEIKKLTFDLDNKFVIATLKVNIDPNIIIAKINEAGFEVGDSKQQ